MTYSINDFEPGQRVQLAPWTDLWMRGAQYGDVIKVVKTRKIAKVHVQLDKVKHFVSLSPDKIFEIIQ